MMRGWQWPTRCVAARTFVRDAGSFLILSVEQRNLLKAPCSCKCVVARGML